MILLDPTCLVHGLRRSEHECIYCCLCFASLTREECSRNEEGELQDVCRPCLADEQRRMDAA